MVKQRTRKGTAIGGAFALTLAGLVSQGINYGIHIGLGRFLSPAVYGSFGIIASIFGLLEVILRWGLPRAISFYIAQDKDAARAVLKKSLALQTVYALACFLALFWCADALAQALGDAGLSPYLRLSAFFSLTFGLVPVYSGLLNGLEAFGKQAGMTVRKDLAKLLLVVILFAVGMEIYGVVVAYILSPLVGIAYAMRGTRPNPFTDKTQITAKDLVTFGLPLFISSVAISLLMRIDLFMAQSLLGDRVLTGLYTSASTLIRAPYFLSLGSGAVLFRLVAQLRTRSPAEVREFISRGMRYYLLGLAPIPFILMSTGEEILRLIFGDAYLPAASPFRILTVCFVFMVLYSVVTTIIAALDRPRFSMALSLLLVPMEVLLIYVWIFTKGLMGVAVATTATWALGTILGGFYLLHQGYFVLPGWKTFLNLGIASLSSYCLAVWISPAGVWLFLFYPLIYFFYLVVLRLTGEVSNAEQQALLAALRPRRHRIQTA